LALVVRCLTARDVEEQAHVEVNGNGHIVGPSALLHARPGHVGTGQVWLGFGRDLPEGSTAPAGAAAKSEPQADFNIAAPPAAMANLSLAAGSASQQLQQASQTATGSSVALPPPALAAVPAVNPLLAASTPAPSVSSRGALAAATPTVPASVVAATQAPIVQTPAPLPAAAAAEPPVVAISPLTANNPPAGTVPAERAPPAAQSPARDSQPSPPAQGSDVGAAPVSGAAPQMQTAVDRMEPAGPAKESMPPTGTVVSNSTAEEHTKLEAALKIAPPGLASAAGGAPVVASQPVVRHEIAGLNGSVADDPPPSGQPLDKGLASDVMSWLLLGAFFTALGFLCIWSTSSESKILNRFQTQRRTLTATPSVRRSMMVGARRPPPVSD